MGSTNKVHTLELIDHAESPRSGRFVQLNGSNELGVRLSSAEKEKFKVISETFVLPSRSHTYLSTYLKVLDLLYDKLTNEYSKENPRLCRATQATDDSESEPEDLQNDGCQSAEQVTSDASSDRCKLPGDQIAQEIGFCRDCAGSATFQRYESEQAYKINGNDSSLMLPALSRKKSSLSCSTKEC